TGVVLQTGRMGKYQHVPALLLRPRDGSKLACFECRCDFVPGQSVEASLPAIFMRTPVHSSRASSLPQGTCSFLAAYLSPEPFLQSPRRLEVPSTVTVIGMFCSVPRIVMWEVLAVFD